nr:kinesin-related protein 12-like isoform X1 [Quercus suber]
MATTIPQPLRPLLSQHRTTTTAKFLISRNPAHRWTNTNNNNNSSNNNNSNNNALSSPRLTYFHHPHPHPQLNPVHLPHSLRHRFLLPRHPFRLLRRLCSPPFRHSLTLMTTSQATASDSTQPSNKTVRVVIKGRVQGVFYRNWTVENATQLGLKGWVRNRRDGSVEALFSGNPDVVQEMEQRCRRGPPDAMVTGLEVFPSSDDPGSGFKRKPTA